MRRYIPKKGTLSLIKFFSPVRSIQWNSLPQKYFHLLKVIAHESSCPRLRTMLYYINRKIFLFKINMSKTWTQLRPFFLTIRKYLCLHRKWKNYLLKAPLICSYILRLYSGQFTYSRSQGNLVFWSQSSKEFVFGYSRKNGRTIRTSNNSSVDLVTQNVWLFHPELPTVTNTKT